MLIEGELVNVGYLVALGVLDYQLSLTKVIDEYWEVAVVSLIVRFSESSFGGIDSLYLSVLIENVACLQKY